MDCIDLVRCVLVLRCGLAGVDITPSEIHTKPINTLCGPNVELLNVKLVVHIVTTEL